jgi:hypothetical protein
MVWGKMPPRAGYSLVLNAIMVILLMTLMGYARSSSRVHWHVYGVMRDSSQYAFSPALGYAAVLMAANTFMFCMIVAFIFWVATMGDKAKPTHGGNEKSGDSHGALPAMAGGSPARESEQ